MTSEEKSATPLAVVDAKSPANQYLIHLLENKGTVSFQNPTEERIRLVFEILDKVTPQLGIFSSVLSLIRGEIHDAVYSPPFIQGQAWTRCEALTQVPYFTLQRRMQTERNEEVDKVMSELLEVKATLLQKEEEVHTLRVAFDDLWEQKRKLEATVSTLQKVLMAKTSEICRLEEKVKFQAQLLETEKWETLQSVSSLKGQLDAVQEHVQRLQERNAAFDALQKAFQSPLARNKMNTLLPAGRFPAEWTPYSLLYKAHVKSYLQTTRHVYQQLLAVRNRVMDDFDAMLENPFQTKDDNQEFNTKKDFVDRMAEISAELALLRQQMESLEQHDLGAELPSKQVSPASQNLPQRAREPQEMTENGDIKGLFTQALHPDEMLLSRYAAMIYTTTDNGKVYEELAGASMCFSCGERTLLCPHKISGTRVVSVPKHCTHIKICRPHLHRIAMVAKLAANTTSNNAETICERSTSSCAISPVTVIPKRRQAELTQKALGEQPNQSGSSSRWQRSWVTEVDFSKLEKHFGNRLKLTREATPRTISLVHCLTIAEQLMVTVFHQQDGRLDHVLSVQELLWDLHIKRYVEEEISTLGLQDFLEALRKFSADSKVLCVLGQVLLRELDTATLLYILLQAEILNVFPVTEMAQFYCFMEQTYPFLQEAEQDSLVLEFTAYSERVVSPDRVLGFILQLILQRREPFIVECEDMLSFYMKTWPGILTNDELSEALDELAPLTSKTQKHSLIQQSLLSLCSKVIPIHSAAQIAAYVMGRENVQKKKEKFLSEKNKEHTEIRLKSGAESPEDAHDLRSLSNVLKFAQIGQSPWHTSVKDRPR